MTMGSLKRILLVEDSPNDAELTMEALSRHSLANDVTWVKDGEEALDFLYCRGKYEGQVCSELVLILLDLKLPKVDGLEVLRTIKSDERLRFVPVVVLTSSREERDLVESYRLGVNAYVVKPVDFTEFMEAVRKLGVFWALVNEPPPARGVPEGRK